MTKNSLIKLFFIKLLVLGVAVRAHAEDEILRVTDVDLRGTFRAMSVLYLKPSGLAGQSRFSVPFANLEGTVQMTHGLSLDFEGIYRSPVAAGQSEFLLPRLNARVPLGPDWRLTVGLFESASLEGHFRFWAWDNLSPNLGWLGIRWGYRPVSDYGFEIVRRSENGAFGLSLTNGEGYPNTEQGAQKDLTVWALHVWKNEERQTELLAQVTRGGYENVPSELAEKERSQISLLTWAEDGIFAGAEVLWTGDPVDAINQKVVDAVDLTDLGGRRVQGRIFSLSFGYSWGWRDGQRWLCFGRSEEVRPVISEPERGVDSSQLGLSFSPTRGQEWIVMASSLHYGPRHSAGIRDEQTWSLSYNVAWD